MKSYSTYISEGGDITPKMLRDIAVKRMHLLSSVRKSAPQEIIVGANKYRIVFDSAGKNYSTIRVEINTLLADQDKKDMKRFFKEITDIVKKTGKENKVPISNNTKKLIQGINIKIASSSKGVLFTFQVN